MNQWFPAGHVRPPVVLGFALREFTVGHWLFLTELNSPILDPSRIIPLPADFLLAVYICMQDHAEARRTIDRWWFVWFCRLWAWRIRKLDPMDEYSKFREYVRDSLSGPQQLRGVLTDGDGVGPAACSLVAYLCRELHQQFSEVLAMPAKSAIWLHASAKEVRGEWHGWTERHEALWQFAQNMKGN